MYGYGPCWHHHGCRHGWGYGPGPGVGPGWGPGRFYGGGRGTKDEELEELEDYKASLEAEIRTLERRIGSLREP